MHILFSTTRRVGLVLVAVLLFAAGCASKPAASTPTPVPVVKPAPVPLPPEQTKKPTLEKDPYQTPPTIPPYRLPGPPPEAPTTGEVPAKATYVAYKGQEDQTALALLKASHKVETKVYSGIGEYVSAIDGTMGDSSHFWAFYVNSKQATVGAGSYVTKPGDSIEWKFEAIK